MDFKFTAEEERFRQQVRHQLEKEVPQEWVREGLFWETSDRSYQYERAFARKLGQTGWLTMAWPKEHFGLGASHMEQLIFQEEMGYQRAPGAPMPGGMGVAWVGPSVIIFGTDEQRREHLPKIAKAETHWCTLYSEPEAGSDLASLKTRVVEEGDYFVVNGQKVWTGGAQHAGWGFLAARTDPNAAKHKGVSIFLLDMKTPGITVRPIIDMTGEHHVNEVFFDNVRIPKGCLLGQKNRGWYQLAAALDFERVAGSGVGWFAEMRRTLEDLTEFARHPLPNQPSAAADPVTRHKLAQTAIELDVGRMLSYRVVWQVSKGAIPNYEASMSRLFQTELEKRLANLGMQILGLYGALDRSSKRAPLRGRFKRSYLMTVSATIAAGTAEIQRNIIAGRGLGLPR